jgi:hypothetical protein
VSAYNFTEIASLGAKTDRNSVFHGRDSHIWVFMDFEKKLNFHLFGEKLTKTPYFLAVTPYSLSVIHNGPLYEFLWVSKNWNILSKYISVSLRFHQNHQFGGKNIPKLHISWSWSPYSELVIHSSPVYENFYVLKKWNFSSKSTDVILQLYRKSPVWGKNRSKLRISWSWPAYYVSVIHNGPIFDFLWILKKIKFLIKIHWC